MTDVVQDEWRATFMGDNPMPAPAVRRGADAVAGGAVGGVGGPEAHDDHCSVDRPASPCPTSVEVDPSVARQASAPALKSHGSAAILVEGSLRSSSV